MRFPCVGMIAGREWLEWERDMDRSTAAIADRADITACLNRLAYCRRLALVRFVLRSSKESSLISTALNHVWMDRPEATMDEVKAFSAALEACEQAGLVRIRYGLPVTLQADYAVFQQSRLYADFCDMVSAGSQRPGFLFDIPYMKRGAAVLTSAGRRYIANESENQKSEETA